MAAAAPAPRHRSLVASVDLFVAAVAEQPELRGIARRFSEAEMAEGLWRQQPTARRALEQAALDQVRLDDVLDGVARLRQRRRQRLDADRPAAVVHSERGQVA